MFLEPQFISVPGQANMNEENIFNSSIQRTKVILKLWSKWLTYWRIFSEVMLWVGTSAGPVIVLSMIVSAEFYLIFKPVMYLPFAYFDYKRAYLQAKLEVAKMFKFHLRFWHNHEVVGFNKIPDQGGALIVYYHGGRVTRHFEPFYSIKRHFWKNKNQ